ncbi:MAG: carboxypeptidase regulatory-like domain-containing protein [bacterium]
MRKKKKSVLVSLVAGFSTALLIYGCGGGGGGGGSKNSGGGGSSPQQTTVTLSGEVYDDILEGATVSVYRTDPNHPIVQAVTDPNGAYQAQVTVDTGTDTVYIRATGGKFADSGEEFNGNLYGVAPLKDAVNNSLKAHLNPVTSLLRSYLAQTPGTTMEDALTRLRARLNQIDANAPDDLARSDLTRLSSGNALVRRVSNLLSYQVNQDDPNVSDIDRVIGRIAAGWLPDAGRLRQSLELAENAVRNGKGELTGKVIDLYTENPVQGATVSIRGTAFRSQTDAEGNFFFRRLPTGMDLIVDGEAPGYASTQEVVEIPCLEKNQGVIIKLKAVTSRVQLDLDKGILARYNARARNMADGGIQVSTPDSSVVMTIPLNALGRIRNHLSRQRRYSGTEEDRIVYVNITPVDPSLEIEAFPGDFTTSDPNAAGENEGRQRKLESVVLGEFSLQYEDGTPVTGLDLGEGVEIRFRLPDSLQKLYRQKYDQGERTIPWYAYDPNDGIWERSAQPSELILVDDTLYAVARATHFSWWNVDWPVETHGCIRGWVWRDGLPLAGAHIQATGIDYQGQSFAMTDPNGYYEVTVKKDAWSRITALFGDHEVRDPNSIYVDLQKAEGCKRVDINFHLVNICGRVINSQNNSGIHGAYVYADAGIGKFTDPNGEFHLISDPNSILKLKISYTHNRIDYRVTRDVEIRSEDLCEDHKVIIPLNLSPQYVRGLVTIIEDGVKKPLSGREVKIAASNGFTTVNDKSGFYEVAAERGTSQLNVTYRYYARNGTYLEQNRTFSWPDPDTLQGDPNVTFEVRPAYIYGTVTDLTSGSPVGDVRISTTLGTYTLSDSDTGEYELEVPADARFEAVARLVIPAAGIVEEDRRQVVTDFSDQSRILVNFTLDSRVARIAGKVTELGTGSPLPYVSVISEYKNRATTDAEGNFTLVVPDRQTDEMVQVAFTCDGYKPEFREFQTPENRGDTINVQVELSQPNFRPIIQKVDIQPGLRVCWGGNPDSTTVTLNITALDSNGDHLTYQVIAEPAAVASDPNRFTWKAPSIGQHSLTVQVSDGKPEENGLATIRLPIEVVECSENRPPVILYMVPRKSATGTPGETKGFEVTAYDPDGDLLSYQWQIFKKPLADQDLSSGWSLSNPTGRSTSLTIPTGLFDGLDASEPIEFAVRVTATDSGGKKAEKETSLTVVANYPPVIRSCKVEPNQCILGDSVKLFALAADLDGDNPLVYTWSCKDVTIGTDPNMVWTLPDDPDYVGDLDIKLTVRDSDPAHPQSVSQTLRLVVGANNAPLITAMSAAKTQVLPDGEVSIQAAVSDPEGRPLSYAWSCTAGEIVTGQGSYAITWKAPPSTGDHTISLKVSDGLRESTRSVTIQVATLTVEAGENRAALLADITSTPIDLNGQVEIIPEGESYTVSWTIDPASIPEGATPALTSPAALSTQFTTNAPGRYHLWLTVTMTANSQISRQDDLWVQVDELAPPTVSGVVKDAQGAPVPRAAVEMYDINGPQVWDRKTATDDYGYYEFRDVPPGTYYVIVARDGYLQMTRIVTIP